jgi:riboflavin transporter FmnP
MWNALAKPFRHRFELLSKERWQNFIVIRSVVDWIFKFIAWNILLATVYAVYAKTRATIILILWCFLAYILIGFVIKFLECLVITRQYGESGQTGIKEISMHIFSLLILYGVFWAIDYNLVNGLINVFGAFQASKQ